MTEIESLKILDIGIATFEESVTGSNDYETFEPVVALDNYDYEVAKWIANVELKRQRILVEKEIDRHERLSFLASTSVLGAISDYVMGGDAVQQENQSLLIDEYWSTVSVDVKYRGLSKEQIRGVLVLQNVFRTWLILKRYRDNVKTKATTGTKSFGDDKGIATALYVQASVRRVLAIHAVEAKIQSNKLRDQAFAKFCKEMKQGIKVTMYSRKYGTAPDRIISFDKDLNYLTFSTSFGTRGKIALRSIYKIHTGISETMYPHSRQAALSRSICLECLADRVVDMELVNAQQARDMYLGFERLILLLSGTTSPFYVDNFGIPRRGGTSIVENAIEEATAKNNPEDSEKVYKSKPDEMRFWGAVRLLQQEYDSWQVEQNAERSAHDLHKKELEEDSSSKRQSLSEGEKTANEANNNKKKPDVTRLVRFINEDGVSCLVQQGAFNTSGDDMRTKPSCLSVPSGSLTSDYDTILPQQQQQQQQQLQLQQLQQQQQRRASDIKSSTGTDDSNISKTSKWTFDMFKRKLKTDSLDRYSQKSFEEKMDDIRSHDSVTAMAARNALGQLSSPNSTETMDLAIQRMEARKYSMISPLQTEIKADNISNISTTTTSNISKTENIKTLNTKSLDSIEKSKVLQRISSISSAGISSISVASSVAPSFWKFLFCLAPILDDDGERDYIMTLNASNTSTPLPSGTIVGGLSMIDEEDEDEDDESDSEGEESSESDGIDKQSVSTYNEFEKDDDDEEEEEDEEEEDDEEEDSEEESDSDGNDDSEEGEENEDEDEDDDDEEEGEEDDDDVRSEDAVAAANSSDEDGDEDW